MSAEAFEKPISRVISNSEINTWRRCQRQYFYSYDMGIEPIMSRKGRALMIGNIGHWTKQRYFEHLMENQGDFKGAKNIAMTWLAMYMADSELVSVSEYASLVMRKLDKYFDYFPELHPGAQILEVEKFYKVDLVDEFSYGFTGDLLMQDGPFIYLIDHKWTYDFWNQIELDTKGAAQLSKYYWAMKHVLGKPIDMVMINEFRYRERVKNPMTPEEQFRETSWTPTVPAMNNLMIEQVRTSRRIINHRKLSFEEREATVERNIGTDICKYCDFATLCLAQLNGEDITEDIATNFQAKTYDYNEAKGEVIVSPSGEAQRDY